jgi:hypothetical protein
MQSNMAFATSQANNATAIIADSVNYPRLRLFTVKNPRGNALAVDVNTSTNYTWGISSPVRQLFCHSYTKTIISPRQARDKRRENSKILPLYQATVGGPGFGWFSAVCFLYGRDLYTALEEEVPIGLVASNVVRKTPSFFGAIFVLKLIYLPTQAPDKHK